MTCSSLADLFDACRAEGVTFTATPHGTLKLGGLRPKEECRAHLVEAKEGVLAALTLADRLERGWRLCEEATGRERDRLESHWIALLHEYEALMDTKPPLPETTHL